MKIKVLNLYAGIGGNRKLWKNVEVTAIENKPEIAKIYKDFFPNDVIIVTDAHQYLLKNHEGFNFIWSSPPCPSHSRIRNIAGVGRGQNKPIYPDLKLYQEILFLKHYCKDNIKWVVENVIPYYKPLKCEVKEQKINRHLFWANFNISKIKNKTMFFPKDSLPKLQEIYGIDLSNLKIKIDKRIILRNMINPKLGLHILKAAFNETQEKLK